MYQFLIDVITGYIIIGLIAAVGWLIHGLFIYKGGFKHPAQESDLVLVGIICGVITVCWLPSALSIIAIKWQHWKYGDFTGEAQYPESKRYRDRHVKDEHEDGPGF